MERYRSFEYEALEYNYADNISVWHCRCLLPNINWQFDRGIFLELM